MRTTAAWLILAAGLTQAALAQQGWAQGDQDGAAIAARWCSNCHATGLAQQRRAQDVAPTFDNIAARLDAGQIEAALIAPHEPMRGIDLSSRDIAKMVEFIADRAPQRP